MPKQEQDIKNLASLQEELKYNKLYQKKDTSVVTSAMTIKAKRLLLSKYRTYLDLSHSDNPKYDTNFFKAVKKTIDFIESKVENKEKLIKIEAENKEKLTRAKIDNKKNLENIIHVNKEKLSKVITKNKIALEDNDIDDKEILIEISVKNKERLTKVKIENKERLTKVKIESEEKINKIKNLDDLVLNINYSKDKYDDLKKEISSFVDIYKNKILMIKELGIKETKYVEVTEELKTLKSDPKPSNLYASKLRKLEIKHTQLRIRIKDLKEFIKIESRSRKLYLSDEPALTPAGWAKLLLSYAFLLFWAIVIIWPIYELVKTTFNDASTTYLDATKFTFGTSAYSRLFNDTDYTSWLINTLIISVATSLITVGFTLLMGYAFSRFRFKGKKMSLLSIMLLQMVPTLAALTVFYVMYTLLHESVNMDGRVVLSIIYIGGGIAGNTFIMKGYMDSISMEIDEAAKIDGLSQWRIFTRIIGPLTKPMIALVALWSFIGPFGDYILPGLLLTDSKDYTLAKGLQTLVSDPRNIDQPAYAAGAVITALPISILFISLRKFLVGGMTAGGVKG